MYGKKVKLRALFIFLLLVSVILSIFLVLKSLEENVVYFLSPTEIKNLPEINNKKIRIGGMVKSQSIIVNSDKVIFIVTDFKNEINVSYSGLVPNLFEEGKGVVAVTVANAGKDYVVLLRTDGYSEVSYNGSVVVP